MTSNRSPHDVIATVVVVLLPVLLCPSTLIAIVDARVVATQLSQRIVTTRYGQLRGILVTLPVSVGVSALPAVEAYLGVEYGSLLGGELRFMPPTSPVARWDGVRSALKFRPVCPQTVPNGGAGSGTPGGGGASSGEGGASSSHTMARRRVEQLRRIRPFLERQNEECLSVNIYVPVVTDKNVTRLQVVLFVHGYSYETGTGNAYDGSVLAAFGRVIVITMNYRLGVLGFLSTGDRHAPGNYAMLDIVAALHWIADNIRAFGGDPNEVTLMGVDHGAALVNLLLLSPVTRGKGLFRRAIIHGGSAVSSWAMSDDPLRYTQLVASKLNCSRFFDSGLMLHCLKQFSITELVEAGVGPSFKYLPRFGPIVDGHWLVTSSPRELMTNCRDNVWPSVPLLIGTAESPGFGFMTSQALEHGITEYEMIKQMRTYVQNTFQRNRQTLLDVISYNYATWEWPRDQRRVRNQLAALLGDGQVLAPTVEAARHHASCRRQQQQVSTYLYRLESGESFGNQTEDFRDELANLLGSPLVGGVDPFIGYSTTVADRVSSELVLSYVTNFIRTGNPNNDVDVKRRRSNADQFSRSTSLRNQWPPYDISNERFLSIGPSGATVNHHLRSDKMALWLELVPKLQLVNDSSLDSLEDANNSSSFDDANGATRLEPVLPLATMLQRRDVIADTQSSSSVVGNHSDDQLATTLPASNRELQGASHRGPSAKRRYQTTPTNVPLSVSQAEKKSSDEVTWTIKVTAAVGVLMTLLNTAVFVAAACQWRRLKKLRKRFPLGKRLSESHREQEDHLEISLDNSCSNASGGEFNHVENGPDDDAGKRYPTALVEELQSTNHFVTKWLTRRASPKRPDGSRSGASTTNRLQALSTIGSTKHDELVRFDCVDETVDKAFDSSVKALGQGQGHDQGQGPHAIRDDRLEIHSSLTVIPAAQETGHNPALSGTNFNGATGNHLTLPLIRNGPTSVASTFHCRQETSGIFERSYTWRPDGDIRRPVGRLSCDVEVVDQQQLPSSVQRTSCANENAATFTSFFKDGHVGVPDKPDVDGQSNALMVMSPSLGASSMPIGDEQSASARRLDSNVVVGTAV